MDALDQSEELTELGRHLADLPVDPHLGKMVLNSIVLKCIDPVLTIVCSLSYKDPCKCSYGCHSHSLNTIFSETMGPLKPNMDGGTKVYILGPVHMIKMALLYTVELQWLEHLWDHENLFETGIVRASEG